MALPSDNWLNLTKLLPGMTPDSVQKEWTGSSGDTLLRQSSNFMNFLTAPFAGVTGQSIHGKNVLDSAAVGDACYAGQPFSMTRSSITVATHGPFRFSIGLTARKRRARREPRPLQRAREGGAETLTGQLSTLAIGGEDEHVALVIQFQ
ncbi:hypothetical protein I6F35_37915 [Bradyrhizobium sp. BRP22]|uniref:hypothetical protein n=1 Tax=Bradyrhizobium sp. BRP22 TaxID=2793821 RepID=UPI001CD7275D|nr:hypothetical protein [Bradyrhizobium sp. BRP22]MCA1458848.1 hypothetical protein [Bradyrhizobium sp. BRP22]